MRFIKRTKKNQTSEKIEIKPKQKESFVPPEIAELEKEVEDLKQIAQLALNEQYDKPIKNVSIDQNLYQALLDLRKQMRDDDTDPEIKGKDLINQIEIYKQQVPPEEQVISGFELKGIPTAGGIQYPSSDGTQVWVKNKDGVYLVTNIDLRAKPEAGADPDYETPSLPDNEGITVADVINGFKEFDGDISEYKKQLKGIVDDKVLEQGTKQVKVQESKSGGSFKNIEPMEMPEFKCNLNVDWRTILFYKLLMDFESKLDITRIILGYTIKPIEILINWFFSNLRKIGFSIKIGWVNFRWYPFEWIPLVTWWEDIIYFLAVKEYESMCSLMRFNRNMALATNDGQNYFFENKYDNIQKHSNKLTVDQHKALQVLQFGYNKFNGDRFTEDRIKELLGNVL